MSFVRGRSVCGSLCLRVALLTDVAGSARPSRTREESPPMGLTLPKEVRLRSGCWREDPVPRCARPAPPSAPAPPAPAATSSFVRPDRPSSTADHTIASGAAAAAPAPNPNSRNGDGGQQAAQAGRAADRPRSWLMAARPSRARGKCAPLEFTPHAIRCADFGSQIPDVPAHAPEEALCERPVQWPAGHCR